MRALKFCRSEGVLTQEGRPIVEGMTPTMPQDCSECEAECGKSATQQRSCRSLRPTIPREEGWGEGGGAEIGEMKKGLIK